MLLQIWVCGGFFSPFALLRFGNHCQMRIFPTPQYTEVKDRSSAQSISKLILRDSTAMCLSRNNGSVGQNNPPPTFEQFSTFYSLLCFWNGKAFMRGFIIMPSITDECAKQKWMYLCGNVPLLFTHYGWLDLGIYRTWWIDLLDISVRSAIMEQLTALIILSISEKCSAQPK